MTNVTEILSERYLSPQFMVNPPLDDYTYILELQHKGKPHSRFVPIKWNGIKFELREIDDFQPQPVTRTDLAEAAKRYCEMVGILVEQINGSFLDDLADEDKQKCLDRLTADVIKAKDRLLGVALKELELSRGKDA